MGTTKLNRVYGQIRLLWEAGTWELVLMEQRVKTLGAEMGSLANNTVGRFLGAQNNVLGFGQIQER